MAAELPDSIRGRFPLLDRAVYLGSCSQGALSVEVRAAYDQYLTDWDDKGAPWELWVDRADAARDRFARLINATTDEIAVTTSVSAGVSSLLSGLNLPAERSKIVMSDFEFPTIGQNVHAQELLGVRVEHVPAGPDGTIPLESLADAIDEQTGLVAMTHVCFRNGAKTDVKEVVQMAHEVGAVVLLDSFQAVGAIPIDVRELDVDFVVGGRFEVPTRIVWSRLPLLPGRSPPWNRADPDRVVRRRGHPPHGYPGLFTIAHGKKVRERDTAYT